MPLDFSSAAQLFMGTEEELARALGIEVADVRALRVTPAQAQPELLRKLGHILAERGRGMARVGQMLREEHGS
jgi:hypothetical protein